MCIVFSSAPFGGTILETLVFASGFVDKRLERIVEPLEVRGVQRSYTSNLALLPSTLAWNDDYVFAKTKNKTFKISDMHHFLNQVGFTEGADMMNHIVNKTELMLTTAPNVPIYCFYGNKPNSTVRQLIFGDNFPDQTTELKFGSGDESVNLESLALCEMFTKTQNESVTVEELPNVGHLDILQNENLFAALRSLLL